MSVLMYTRSPMSAKQTRWLKENLIGLGLKPETMVESPEYWKLDDISPETAEKVAQLWGVKAILSLDGEIIARGRRHFLEFALPKLILCLGMITVLIILGSWLPAGLGERPDLHSAPQQLVPEWYIMPVHVFFSMLPDSLGFMGPVLLATALTVLLIWPFVETSTDTHWKKRPMAVGLGAIILATTILLTLYGYSTT